MSDPTARDPRPPIPLHAHAADDLRYIRSTLERATAFTSISGWGEVAVGLTALGAAAFTWRLADPDRWLVAWLFEASIAMALSVGAAALKAQRLRVALFGVAGQRFALAFAAPAVTGAVLTVALVRSGQFSLLPGMWLLTYGAAVASGGAFSVRPVPLLGAVCIACGIGAVATPAAWSTAWLAAGFGLAHVGFGWWIARRHGG